MLACLAPSPDISPAEQRLRRKILKWYEKNRYFQNVGRKQPVPGAVLSRFRRFLARRGLRCTGMYRCRRRQEKARPQSGRGAGLDHAASGMFAQVIATEVSIRGAEAGWRNRFAFRPTCPPYPHRVDCVGWNRVAGSTGWFHGRNDTPHWCVRRSPAHRRSHPRLRPGPLLCASSGSVVPHRRSGGCEFRGFSGCW